MTSEYIYSKNLKLEFDKSIILMGYFLTSLSCYKNTYLAQDVRLFDNTMNKFSRSVSIDPFAPSSREPHCQVHLTPLGFNCILDHKTSFNNLEDLN